MKTLFLNIKNQLKKCDWLYSVHREIKLLKLQKKGLWAYAIKQFEENHPEHGSLRDYRRAMRMHRVVLQEYYTYEFWNLSEKERKKYLSEKELKCIYRKVESMHEIKWINNKLMTHLKFEKYMKRDWICPSTSSFDAFRQFVSSKDCIVKPWHGSLGEGIFMVNKDNILDLKNLYDNCIENGLFVEESVRSCKELEEFHPQSLNTIRVITMSKGEQFRVLSCLLRMGIGENVVDNAATGGILAAIDPDTGILMDDGKDKKGNTYSRHPDTGKVIKGFAIPHWDKVIEACKEMVALIPNKIFAGWDVCILENGEVELIEVNGAPNIMGSQITHGYGFRPKIQAIGKDLLGYDLMKLISVWSRPCSNYHDYIQYKKHSQDFNLLLKDYIACLTDHENLH